MLHRILWKENRLCKVCISGNKDCEGVYLWGCILRVNDGGDYFWSLRAWGSWLPTLNINLKYNEVGHLAGTVRGAHYDS